ncbi:MAG: UvrD-helicase domain-containing protein [Deltaproteobacteria bacterium]|nr:UvrD-helicase domain-containing protein [Candidatus Tharpella aukensis]
MSNTWLIPREELTPTQLRAIELDPSENRIILGGPGSGKTQILLHRGQYLMEQHCCKSENFHIFVYTKALRTYIQSALPLLGLEDEVISTLDSWCMDFYRQHIGGSTPWNKKSKQPDFFAIRKSVLDKLQSNGKKFFDFVLVDEAQDLNTDAFQLLTTMARHVTVCADHKQQIYDNGSDIPAILQQLDIRRNNITLLETYRCCPYIVQLASHLIEDLSERNEYVRQLRTSQGERETPLLAYAKDAQDEKEQLIDLVRTRLAKGERVAVLFPQRRQAYGYAKAFTEADIEVENPKNLDFTSDKPKLMPYHSAKGLTFDSVIMPRLGKKSFGSIDSERIMRLLFVGITRATKWVALLTVGDEQFKPLKSLLSGAKQGCLTIRRLEDCQVGNTPDDQIDEQLQEDDILDIL